MNNDIGFQYGDSAAVFHNESLATSANQFDLVNSNPHDGRLYKPCKWWCPRSPFHSFYLELILVEKYYIFAVSVDGRRTSSNFTKSFDVSYSDDYAKWIQNNDKYTVSTPYITLAELVSV